MRNHIPILSTKKLKPSIARQALLSGLDLFDTDFIKITYRVSVPVAEALSKTKECVVFTSRNGVKGYILNKNKSGFQSQNQKAYCLQGETLEAIEEISNIEIVSIAKDATSLAKKIIVDRNIKAVSYICGNRRRDELPKLLGQCQVEVDEIVVYETSDSGQLIKHGYKAVLFFSPSAVEIFFQTNILPRNIPCFCIGITTAAAVKEHTHNPIIIANHATQESMLEAVQIYFRKNKKAN